MKNIAKVSSVIIGTMIGAGFASGQEINLFFSPYGIKGILGIIISCSLTGIIIGITLTIVTKNNIQNYEELLNHISPTKKLNKIIKIIVTLFLLTSFYIMIAGFCTYFNQEWNIPIMITAITVSLLCYITFQKNIQGVLSINTMLIPALILFILYLGIKNIAFTKGYLINFQTTHHAPIKWLMSSLLYASYNSIILIPILIELKPYMNTKNKIKAVSFSCSVILAILGICLFCLLQKQHVHPIELPILHIVKQFGTLYPLFYGMVIIAAIFTSAISAGYSFLKSSAKTKKNYQKYLIFLCVSALFIAKISFSTLVNIWYPSFGLLGLMQIFLLFYKAAIEKKNKN